MGIKLQYLLDEDCFLRFGEPSVLEPEICFEVTPEILLASEVGGTL